MTIEVKEEIPNCSDCPRKPKSFCIPSGEDRLFFQPVKDYVPKGPKYEEGIILSGSVKDCQYRG